MSAYYKLIGEIVREVTETIELEIEADDPEEAKDVAFEILSDYPNSDLVATRMRVIRRVNNYNPAVDSLEFVRTEQEEVFYDDGA